VIGEVVVERFHFHENVRLVFFTLYQMYNTHDLTVSYVRLGWWDHLVVREYQSNRFGEVRHFLFVANTSR